jgi:hypothetical protein
MTRKRLVLVAMPLALMASVTGGSAASAATDHQIALHGSFSGTAAFTSTTTALFTGTGTAGHLGRSRNENNITLTGPASCPGGFGNINVEKLTAANGDTLVLTGDHDQACPTGPNAVHGIGEWTVTRGTGRFAGATGKGTFDGVADFDRGTFSFQLNGTISAPGDD